MPAFLASLPPDLIRALARDWLHTARADQLPPCPSPAGHAPPWTTWAVVGGRGSGKTRTGAEWVRALALGDPAFTTRPVGRIALVGETFADVRDVMIEGPSGLLSLNGPRPRWSPSRRRLDWANGAVGLAFSAEEPDSLRGPQFGAAWSDEIAKWRYADSAWDMIQFGLRLGHAPRGLVTTTPRPIPLLRRLLADPLTVVSRSRTADNAENLAPRFLDAVVGRYAGTRLGRQELDGELIEDRADALWTRAPLEAARVARPPEDLRRIVVAVDPPATAKAGADACGIVAAGLASSGHAYVLADATLARATPEAWAGAALALYHRLSADGLVVEVNQGGEMVTSVLAQVDAAVPVIPVRATRGKYLRAEPVLVLYAQGRVHHVGALPALEDELCEFVSVIDFIGFSSDFLQTFYKRCSRRVPLCKTATVQTRQLALLLSVHYGWFPASPAWEGRRKKRTFAGAARISCFALIAAARTTLATSWQKTRRRDRSPSRELSPTAHGMPLSASAIAHSSRS